MSLDSRELRFFRQCNNFQTMQSTATIAPPSNRESTHPVLIPDLSSLFPPQSMHDNEEQYHPVWSVLSAVATVVSTSLTVAPSISTKQTEVLAAPSSFLPFFHSTTRTLSHSNNQLLIETKSSSTLVSAASGSKKATDSLGKPRQIPKRQPLAQGNNESLSQLRRRRPPQAGYGPSIQLTPEEEELFSLLRHVRNEIGLSTTFRVAGGWVRDKLLATPEFQTYHTIFSVGRRVGAAEHPTRLSSKFRRSHNAFSRSAGSASSGRQGTKVLINNSNSKNSFTAAFHPVDIDIALDDMLGREFADHLNEYLSKHGQDTVSVGMVLKNPDKSKHLETATMKVGSFWIDFVNLRAEEYTQDSRIPDLMRIGSPDEDAYRRDLTINSLFYNINTGQVEDWTGRGFQDLRKGVVSTPLHPLTTLLDDPLRALRSVRFAARLRFTMDDELVKAAQTTSVANALSQKVSRERVGGELDLMLRSPDPVGAIRLLINLKLIHCVFPVADYYKDLIVQHLATKEIPHDKMERLIAHVTDNVFRSGLLLLSTAHDHLADCRWSPPVWCVYQKRVYDAAEVRLIDDEEGRRLLWYASFLKPMHDEFQRISAHKASSPKVSKRNNARHRSIVNKMLVDQLKRPIRDAESIERIIVASDEISQLMNSGFDVSATMILLSEVCVSYKLENQENSDCMNVGRLYCSMNGRPVNSETEDDPVWVHAMEFRSICSKVLLRIGSMWRASLFLSISEELVQLDQKDGIEYTIEGDVMHETQEERRQGVMERYDTFATALQQTGLIGIWNEKPMADGETVLRILPGIPKGPAFREVMDEQVDWMITHPGANMDALTKHLQAKFEVYANKVPTNDLK
jgi:tRNA nucleotidyltransferase/poly(A) polymerase